MPFVLEYITIIGLFEAKLKKVGFYIKSVSISDFKEYAKCVCFKPTAA